MSYYKLMQKLPLFADMSLNIIHKIATSEQQAKDYQAEHYRQTGELLQVEPVKIKGYAVLLRMNFIDRHGKNLQLLTTIESNQQEAVEVAKAFKVAFDFLGAECDVISVNDFRLAKFYLSSAEVANEQ